MYLRNHIPYQTNFKIVLKPITSYAGTDPEQTYITAIVTHSE